MSETQESSNGPEPVSPPHTPAYPAFASNAEKLLFVLKFIGGGVEAFCTNLQSKVVPAVTKLCEEVAALKCEQKAESDIGSQARDLAARLSAIAVTPVSEFVGGFLTIRQWIPVMLVTIVEEYLKDVLMFSAQSDPKIMEISQQSASYSDVSNALSIDDLKRQLQSRWAKNVLDRAGPTYWVKRFTTMGRTGLSRPDRT